MTGAGVGGEKSDFSHCQVDDVDKAAAEPVSGPPRRCCATASRDSGDRLLDRASIVLGEKEEKRDFADCKLQVRTEARRAQNFTQDG